MSGARIAAEHAASRQRIVGLLDGLSGADEQRIVPTCPDWRIRDLVSHMVSISDRLVRGDGPGDDGTDAWVDAGVDARRHFPVAEQLAEWAEVGPRFEAMIADQPKSLSGLLVDTVAHEHDIAHALGVTGEQDHPGVLLALACCKTMIRSDLASNDLGAVELVVDGDVWVLGEGTPELTVRGSAFELFRLTGGRRSRAQLLQSDHDGDILRHRPGLVHLPLPEYDIVE
jgi:uncharacterized protein (TIGR03083 family)